MPEETGRRILAVVTARGGSVGLPGKNTLSFAGKPLIAHSILAAQEAGSDIARLIVSTDDDAIARVATEWGAEVPFRRPAEYSGAEATSLPAVQHAVEFIEAEEGRLYGWVLLLQPTSPLRTSNDIRAAIGLANGDATAVIGVTAVHGAHPAHLRRIDDGYLRLFDESISPNLRRQDLQVLYRVNGAIYLTRRDVLMNTHSFYGVRPRGHIMPRERSIDIDDSLDFDIAEFMYRRTYRVHAES